MKTPLRTRSNYKQSSLIVRSSKGKVQIGYVLYKYVIFRFKMTLLSDALVATFFEVEHILFMKEEDNTFL